MTRLAGDRAGKLGLSEQVRLVRAHAARRRAGVACEVVRRRRRLRAAVARRAGGDASGRNVERMALLARDAGDAAGQLGAMTLLARGEVPSGVADEGAVELVVVGVEDPAFVDAR